MRATIERGRVMIGKRLKEIRKTQGLTQQDLADRIGVSVSSVKKWELDLTEPNADKLVTIALALGVSVDYVLGGMTAPNLTLTEDAQRLALIVEQLPEKQRDALIQYAEFLKEGGRSV